MENKKEIKDQEKSKPIEKSKSLMPMLDKDDIETLKSQLQKYEYLKQKYNL
ncbi:unnamed protein product [Paramecium octaurelia]|uniref:Uncharacterized protein n=1 Tax=Paramecium octaurelia TaxID=43137 RepID=A0A8S1TVY1_PAROT|nr:unnamed protein product [Paramecium octaurelia]